VQDKPGTTADGSGCRLLAAFTAIRNPSESCASRVLTAGSNSRTLRSARAFAMILHRKISAPVHHGPCNGMPDLRVQHGDPRDTRSAQVRRAEHLDRRLGRVRSCPKCRRRIAWPPPGLEPDGTPVPRQPIQRPVFRPRDRRFYRCRSALYRLWPANCWKASVLSTWAAFQLKGRRSLP